jgi:serine protease Do
MVVTTEGHIVTKLSEITDCRELYCKASDGQRFPAKLIGRNKANDLALLKIEQGILPPVVWAARQPEIGSIIVSTGAEARPLAIGIYSNPPRSLIGENQAFLGVKPVDDAAGVRVVEVTAGSSAADAGLLAGDVLIALNGRVMDSVQSLVTEIRRNAPGDKLIVDYLRHGSREQAIATLAGRNVGGPTADRFKQMESFGAIPSRRRAEFPLVFQHDTPLVPEQCGGPVTNLDGDVVGMNIARGGRVASYAIPADHLQQLLGEMLRPNVASKDVD